MFRILLPVAKQNLMPVRYAFLNAFSNIKLVGNLYELYTIFVNLFFVLSI